MLAALVSGRFESDLVAVEARRAGHGPAVPSAPVPLPATAPTLAGAHRAAPSLSGYDDLLTHPLSGRQADRPVEVPA